jgi:hypothetical protein
MSSPKLINSSPTNAQLRHAARLITQGASWDEVAAQLGFDDEECRIWPTLYESFWQEALDEASEEMVRRSRFNALRKLDEQLNHEDPKVASRAAKILVEFSLKFEKQQQQIVEMRRKNQDRGCTSRQPPRPPEADSANTQATHQRNQSPSPLPHRPTNRNGTKSPAEIT